MSLKMRKGRSVQIFNLTGHTNRLELNSLDLYDDRTLVSGSWDRTVKFWNILNGSLIRSINVNIQINALEIEIKA